MEPIAAIGLVMALLAGAAWVARRQDHARAPWSALLKRKAAGRQMSIAERLPLTQHHVLHLVDVGGLRLLIATHPQGLAFVNPRGGAQGFPEILDEKLRGAAGSRRIAEENASCAQSSSC